MLSLPHDGFSRVILSFSMDSGGRGDLYSGGGGDSVEVARSSEPVSAGGEGPVRGVTEVTPNTMRSQEVGIVEGPVSVVQRERSNPEASCENKERS